MKRCCLIIFVPNSKLTTTVQTKSIYFIVFVYVKTMMLSTKNVDCVLCNSFVNYQLNWSYFPGIYLSSNFTEQRITPTIHITIVRQSKSVLGTTGDLFYFLFFTKQIFTNTKWCLIFHCWCTIYKFFVASPKINDIRICVVYD